MHTCLSPCGELDMHPDAIVRESLAQGLDIIAICDHNASENVQYVQRAARNTELVVIPGMEVSTKEEVHMLALFEHLHELSSLQEVIYAHLSDKNDEDIFGCQAIVNESGEVEGFNDRLLIGAADISLNEVVDLVHALGGLAIASHIDRSAFGIIGQLGFVPPDVAFDALEVSFSLGIPAARLKFPELKKYSFITSSDAHFVTDIGKACTRMYLESPTFAEITLALHRQQGRYVLE
jgi:PHP family Zn ribbon phosphoesterase